MLRKLRQRFKSLGTSKPKSSKPKLEDYLYDEIQFLVDPLNNATINYSINVSLQHKYIYVETPKVACSSIKTTLQKLELDQPDIKRFKNIHAPALSSLLRPIQITNFKQVLGSPDFQKFCFVRNPYTRALSGYLDKMFVNGPTKVVFLKTLGRNPRDLNQFISFEDFLKAVESLSVGQRDSHWREQHHQLMYSKIRYDVVGKFESLNKDFLGILETIKPGASAFQTRAGRDPMN